MPEHVEESGKLSHFSAMKLNKADREASTCHQHVGDVLTKLSTEPKQKSLRPCYFLVNSSHKPGKARRLNTWKEFEQVALLFIA